MSNDLNVTVLGAGSWGTTLAILLNKKGIKVSLWEAFPEYAHALTTKRYNEKFLPGVYLDEAIHVTSDLEPVLYDADIIVLAVPTQYIRGVFKRIQEFGKPLKCVLVSVAKGIEVGTLKRVSEIVKEFFGPLGFAVLSGPSHAEEVSRRIPTSVVAASDDESVARRVQSLFMDEECFRVYTNRDVTGVELGGALKNVLAIACGISDGLGFGDNSRAALITRGLAEMTRLALSLGAQKSTLAGLAGVGDLIVTCTSEHSRNRRVGKAIGEGYKLQDILGKMNMVAEGVETSKSVMVLSRKVGIDVPISTQVYQMLFENKDPRAAVKELMQRGAKEE